MLLKLYSALVLTLDILLLVVRCLLSIAKASFQLIVPPAEKSVQGETVLVSVLFQPNLVSVVQAWRNL